MEMATINTSLTFRNATKYVCPGTKEYKVRRGRAGEEVCERDKKGEGKELHFN
jgi:hypothetical protein